MTTKRAAKQSSLKRCSRAPIWVVARIRDLCALSLSLTRYGGGPVGYGNTMGCPTPHIPTLHRSIAANSPAPKCRSAEGELKDLIRLASAGKVGVELRLSKGAAAPEAEPRSLSVGLESIDEEKQFDCGEEEKLGLLDGRVYAV